MKKTLTEIDRILETKQQVDGIRVGEILKIEESGQVWIDFPGNPRGPVAARLTSSAKRDSLTQIANSNKEVLLVFENNDPNLPIIIDILYSPIDELLDATSLSLEPDKPEDIIVDGKRLVFNAKEEIVMHCGKSSITLKKDGKVVVRGTKLISRSSGTNKIKGGIVNIN